MIKKVDSSKIVNESSARQKIHMEIILLHTGYVIANFYTSICSGDRNMQARFIFNTQYMRNSNFVYILKMEYVPKINIFDLKIMVSIHHNLFFEIPPCARKVLFVTEFAILQLFMRQIHLIENDLRM